LWPRSTSKKFAVILIMLHVFLFKMPLSDTSLHHFIIINVH
jgi:hypothetical protein